MSSFKQIESGDATPDLPSGSGESRETKPAKRRRVKRYGKTEPGGAAKKEAGGQTKRPREGRKRGRPGQDGVAPQIEDNVAHDEGSPPKSTDGSPSLTDRKAARKAARQLKKKKAARKLKKLSQREPARRVLRHKVQTTRKITRRKPSGVDAGRSAKTGAMIRRVALKTTLPGTRWQMKKRMTHL